MPAREPSVLGWDAPPRLDGLPPQRVHLGTGDARAALVEEWERRDRPRTLLVGTNASRLALVDLDDAVHWSKARQHVPRDAAEALLDVVDDMRIRFVVAVGGGSAVGFAKWVAVHRGIETAAVPSTLAGSEATTSWSVTEEGRKRVQADPAALPAVVLYDAELVAGMPQLVQSWTNALSHAVDSLWAPRTDERIVGAALDAATALRADTAGVRERDLPRLSRLQRAAHASAGVFSAAGSGVHHRICHVLGGTYGLPHAPVHTAMLPYVAVWSAAADPRRGALLGAALDGSDTADAFARLHTELGAPPTLEELGLPRDAIADAARIVAAAPPVGAARDVDATSIERLVTAAWTGADIRTMED